MYKLEVVNVRKEQGFWQGIVLSSVRTLFICVCVGFVIYNTDISFSGSKIFKPIAPLWERICDKVTGIFS